MIIHTRKELGKLGESIARQYLEKNDYLIIKNNYYCRQGEIDIVAIDKDIVVFIEVKTRTNNHYGRPSESVNKTKQLHMYKAAKYFLYNIIRFDVIEVFLRKNKFNINHIKQIM